MPEIYPKWLTNKSRGFSLLEEASSLGSVMSAGEALGGFGVSTEWRLTESEMADLSHFSVLCRLTVPESDASYKRNYDMWLSSPLIQSEGCEPIRLARGFHMTSIKLRGNSIAGIGEWTEEYVCGADVLDIFREEKLTGFSPEPVFQTRSGAPLPNVSQLYSEVKLSPVASQGLVKTMQEFGGLLCYEIMQLTGQQDFARTAEPWRSPRHGWPLWVISSRVRNLILARGIRGWAFRPVLSTNSAIYDSYLSQAEVLISLIRSAPSSRPESRDW